MDNGKEQSSPETHSTHPLFKAKSGKTEIPTIDEAVDYLQIRAIELSSLTSPPLDYTMMRSS